ncbi:MAG: TolC family protein [Cyclobacteriaceae bacterium]|nr:TolC family protein [Cyclobacteriaceae bacterium]
MSKKIFLFSLVLTCASLAKAQNIFSIEEIISRAKEQSIFSKQAETQRETSYWQYRSFRTNYNPQLRLGGNVPTYSNSVRAVNQPDGSLVYLPLNQINPNVNVGLQQPIALTGGNISANTGYNFFNNISTNATQWSGTVLNVRLSQPVFGYNPWKWDKRIKPIVFEESKRIYVERTEQISSNAVSFFFDVLVQQVNQQIATFNLANNDTINKIEQGRYNIGTTSQDKLLQVQLQLLRSRQEVAQARLDLESARLQLRSYIGLRDGDSFQLVLPDKIPPFEVTVEEALKYARMNRADYIGFERRRLEAESEVAQAKGQRYQTTISASYGLNNVGPTVSDLYSNPTKQQIADVSFNVPIVDWGRRRASMQTAYANKKLRDYVIEQDKITFEQEIITKVNQFEMLRLQIEITKKSDEVAQERYNVAQNRYLIGKIDITNLNIALREKDDAKRSYLQALKSFWTSYYDLRRLTLYDFANKSLLYVPDGED